VEKKEAPPAAAVALAFAIVYVVWGSTYLAIRFAIATVPPLLMAGTRFTVPGLILIGYAFLTRAAIPSRKQVRDAAIAGILMLACGNGAVTWAEQRVSSGLAAVLVATVSSWILILNWKFGNRKGPSASHGIGLLLGLIGTAVLVLPSGAAVLGQGADLVGAGAILGGAFCWASGTLYARSNELPSSPWMTNGVQMLAEVCSCLLLGQLVGKESTSGAFR
jgi:drug/metabolite transporter (DMT)-like permease